VTSLDDLPTPALVFDLDRLEANLVAMAERARRLGVDLRPHLKTHKCVEVARLQAAHGVAGVTVSTLHEARVFADHGFDDLTWAFPLVPSRLAEAAQLAERVTLRLVLDSVVAVDALETAGRPFHVFLKIDCGYHRAGVDPDGDEALELARRLAGSPRLVFDGLLTHSGHAYKARGAEERLAVARQERDVMVRCAERLRASGIEVPRVSVGSTPAMTAVDHLAGIDEARPGNYALFDYTQVALGSCGVSDCAATVVTSVVSAPAGVGHAVVDAGALALSRDPGPAGEEGFGRVYADYRAGALDPELRLTALSQEHGIVSGRPPVDARLRLLPNHSCLTVAQFDEAWAARGDEIVGRWKIWRGRG
jgi:D-serine deaminase-like pyridoxal phosphate-dependent protein